MSVITPEAAALAPEAVREGRGDRLYRLSIEQYHRIAEAGIIPAKAPVMLLEGLLVTKMTRHQPQIIGTNLVQEALTRALPVGWHVSMGNPITIADEDSEPEPDAQVVRGSPRDYKDRRVEPRDVALVVEVVDSSLPDNQGIMKRIYARAGIPVYWIVNIPAGRLEVYTDPPGPDQNPDYRRREEFGPSDVVPLVLDGREVARIAVRDLLP